ncbi:MAG: hypothetical protein DRG36_05595 [Deltaproteobacteria bacterium]|nr:MAG: hypothetical protein DRG36_05595 [Deltaproteobacteria bacterium]RLA86714.1 MAG: hypothetical protein DRG40_02225 [Deltaproteobacteria bacterium]
MKIAIPLYGERVAPRVGFAKEVMVVTLRGKRVEGREVVDISHIPPFQLPAYLASLGVTKLITGGVDGFLGRIFKAHNIDVIWGIIGKADDVLDFYLHGGLRAGMGPCPPRRRRRRGAHILRGMI